MDSNDKGNDGIRRNSAGDGNEDGNSTKDKEVKRFYTRPSLGLKLWGPLVPAADNRIGLWTLLGIQTSVGILCFYRFRKLARPVKPGMNKPMSTMARNVIPPINQVKPQDIATLPTLNRFSTTSPGQLYLNPKATDINGNIINIPNSTNNTITNNGHIAGFKSNQENSESDDRHTWRRVFYLIIGSAILSQSMLEFCRLQILKYDPWYEEAKTARDKKFFNDMIKFYYEGIDPNKIKVKDINSGNTITSNLPEVRQSVAIVRAQNEQRNPIIKWFGPIEFKPMSWSEYLDRVEYFLNMNEILFAKKENMVDKDSPGRFLDFSNNEDNNSNISNDRNSSVDKIKQLIEYDTKEVDVLIEKNKLFRKKIQDGTFKVASDSNNIYFDEVNGDYDSSTSDSVKDKDKINSIQETPAAAFIIPRRSINLDPTIDSADKIDMKNIFTLHDPWLNLALDTSLSIKFIPTMITPGTGEDTEQQQEDGLNSEDPTDADITEE